VENPAVEQSAAFYNRHAEDTVQLSRTSEKVVLDFLSITSVATVSAANVNCRMHLVDVRTQKWIHGVGYEAQILDLDYNEGHVAVTLVNLVLVENVGDDASLFGELKTAAKVEGHFVRATLAGDVLITVDSQGNLSFRNWREGDRPTEPCPFKGGCPEVQRIYLPVTAKLVTGDGRWACGSGGPGDPCAPTPPAGPTTDPGEVPPTPRHGPTVAPVPTDRPGCGYPPCNAAEAAAAFGH
jgi:hypothetical protein